MKVGRLERWWCVKKGKTVRWAGLREVCEHVGCAIRFTCSCNGHCNV